MDDRNFFIIAIGSLLITGLVTKCRVDAYNKVTGSDISFFEGLFLNLRVESPPAK